MPLTLKLSSSSLLDSATEVIALGVTESALDKQKALVALDEALQKKLLGHAARTKFTGASGQVLDVPTLGQLPAARIVLIGMGKVRRASDAPALRTLAASAARQAINAASLSLLLPEKVAGAPALRAVGYRQAWEHLDGAAASGEFRDRAIFATRQLAKRQLTWLRGELDAQWVDPATDRDRLQSAIALFLP